MRVYLDFNIIVSIIKKDISLDYVLKNINVSDEYELPFSSAHIYEVDNITANDSKIRLKHIVEHLKMLKILTNSLYLYHELPTNNVLSLNESPFEVYKTITEGIIDCKPIFRNMVNVVSDEQKDDLRASLGLDKRHLNNYNPQEVIKHLDTKIIGLGMSCLELIEYGITLHPDGKSFGLHNRFAGIFELLDMFGYWTDKITTSSNVARLWDSSHCYFASFCDYFVSDDKRTRNKAQVAYDIYGLKTKILSSKGE